MTELKRQADKIKNWKLTPVSASLLAGLIALVIFLSTLQLGINGSSHPYTTDVGEIQNALPRWGTIHFTGYPQFTFFGSLFVSLAGIFGISPAAAGSLFSALWGAVSVGLLTFLATMFGVSNWAAIVAALLFGVSTSYWVDASIAEVHTMTMAISFGSIIAAVYFGRGGKARDLYILAFLSGQGLAHQRAFAFLGLGLLIFILPRWRQIIRRLPQVIALFLIGPFTYIYLPIRAWQGAEWTFNSPGTWNGFWSILFDNKADRIVEVPVSGAQWTARIEGIFTLLADDWPWFLLIAGLLALLLAGSNISRRERIALSLLWLPYLIVGLIIWIGRVGEAVLAVKLMIVAMAALGLSFIIKSLDNWRPGFGWIGVTAGFLLLLFLILTGRPTVAAITRDQSALETIAVVDRLESTDDQRAITFMALEGNDFWQLSYAQEFENHFLDLDIVNHSRDFQGVLQRGNRLMTLSRSFFLRSVEEWQQLLGPISLSAVAPGIVEITAEPSLNVQALAEADNFDLENGLFIHSHNLKWLGDQKLQLDISWQAVKSVADYRVAVHLVALDPPLGPDDIINQADRTNPVDGWYPTSHWSPGEFVRDSYLIEVPAGSQPAAVRIGLYQQLEDGSFSNTPWLSIPIPPS